MRTKAEWGSLSGFDEFDKKLKELPKRVEDRILQKAVSNSLREILRDMRSVLPRDTNGQSAASKMYGRARRNLRVVRLKRVRKGEKGARIMTGNAFWMVFYELGTRFQPARPVFAPFFRKSQDRIIKNLGRELGEGIEREAKL